jgi:hypothetical protein
MAQQVVNGDLAKHKRKFLQFVMIFHNQFNYANIVLIVKIEALFQVVYNYYAQSLKQTLENTKLVKCLKKNVLKIMRNVRRTH